MKRANTVSPQADSKRRRNLDEKQVLKKDFLNSLRLKIKSNVTDIDELNEMLHIVEEIRKYMKSIERSLTDSQGSVEELRKKRIATQCEEQEKFLQRELLPESGVVLQRYENFNIKQKDEYLLKSLLLSVQRDEEQRIKYNVKMSKNEICTYAEDKIREKFQQFNAVLDLEKQKAIADIKDSLNAKVIARLQDETLNISSKAIGSLSNLSGRVGFRNSNIIASPTAVALVHRQIECLGFHVLKTKISDDNVCSQISVSSFLSLFIKTHLKPKNWSHDIPFQMVYHIDGTRKHLQNVITAGLKIAKKKSQNYILCSTSNDNLESIKIHSPEWYFALINAFCSEKGANVNKYFGDFFQELENIQENGVEFEGLIYKFEILGCVDMKACWGLLGYGGANAKCKSCCPDRKEDRHRQQLSCKQGSCISRTTCVHRLQHFSTKSVDLDISWFMPTDERLDIISDISDISTWRSRNDYSTLIYETDLDELRTPANLKKIEENLRIRFEGLSSEHGVNCDFSCVTEIIDYYKEKFKLTSNLDLLKYCVQKENAFTWLQSIENKSIDSLWVDRMLLIPDTLHMELRVGEELLTQIVQRLVLNRTDICDAEKERKLEHVGCALSSIMNKNSAEQLNFKLNVQPNNKCKLQKITLNNSRLRIILRDFHTLFDKHIIYSDAEILKPEIEVEISNTCDVVSLWLKVIDALCHDRDMSIDDADRSQDTIDLFCEKYFCLFPNSYGTYLHLLEAGHLRDYIKSHGNIHRFNTTDGEAHNGRTKTFLTHRTQNGGHIGGASSNRKECLAKSILRLSVRRIMYLCDPNALDRLENIIKSKTDIQYGKRDIITSQESTEDDPMPQNYKYDKALLDSTFCSDNYNTSLNANV